MKLEQIKELIKRFPDSDIAIAYRLGNQEARDACQDNIIIRNTPQGCHTGKHTHHVFVPWMYDQPYDKSCNICGYPAAALFSVFPLCDCCAQDWHEFCEEQRKEGIEINRGNWNTLYQQFRDKMLNMSERIAI
jgi:hypothetical protein